jgi:DNA-binding MarR family transcriptional regulator
MEILENENKLALSGDVKPNTGEAIALVQGFVQMWIRYEATMHRELASMTPLHGDRTPSSRLHSYISNGYFYKVSSNIIKHRSPTMGELSVALSVPFSTATRIIDGMVEDGYVKRMPDPEDRRIVKVALTSKGMQLHNMIEKVTAEHVQQILSVLSAEEQEALFRLIGKVMKALEQMA